MKSSFALFALVFALPALSLADDWNKHFDVNGKPELHVTAGDAAIRVHAGAGSGIDASVKTEGVSIGNSGVQIDARQNGDRVELEIRLPKEQFSWHNRSVRVDIRVPQSLAAFLHTGDGPISIENVHGDVHAQAGDGPIRVEGFEGTLDAQTGDGPVNLRGKFSDLRITTGDGPVDVTADSGSHIENGWRLHTGDGPVRIKVPSTLSADLVLHSGDGPISNSLNLTNVGQQSQHNLHGKLNGGGPELSIHTGDGPISIGQS